MKKKFISIPFATIEGQVRVVGLSAGDKKLVKIYARPMTPAPNSSIADEYVEASSTPQPYRLIVGLGAFDVYAEFEGAVSPLERLTLQRGQTAEVNFQFERRPAPAAGLMEGLDLEEEPMPHLRPFLLN